MNMKIYYATKNSAKVESAKKVLSEYGIEVVHACMDLPEPRSDDLREIAKNKAVFAYSNLQKPCMALDAGFYINSLNGFPKAFVNFALETIKIEGILRLTDGLERECEFRDCLAYVDKYVGEPEFF
jgi:XTP/dITP diphosphohydrolase